MNYQLLLLSLLIELNIKPCLFSFPSDENSEVKKPKHWSKVDARKIVSKNLDMDLFMIDLDAEVNDSEHKEAKVINIESVIDEESISTRETSEMSLAIESSDCEDDSIPNYEDFSEEIIDIDDNQEDHLFNDTEEVWVIDESHRQISFDSNGRLSVIHEEDNIEIIDLSNEDDESSKDAMLNIQSVEEDDNLITNFQIIKFAKDDKHKKSSGGNNFNVLQFIVNKQLSESRRRPTKASLARQRKIRENYPDLTISNKSKKVSKKYKK